MVYSKNSISNCLLLLHRTHFIFVFEFVSFKLAKLTNFSRFLMVPKISNIDYVACD